MYILIVLSVEDNEIEIVNCFNEELVAQNNYLDKIAELSQSDSATQYESVMISKTKCHVIRKLVGWTGSSKTLEKIITLHDVKDYDICSDSL